LVREGGSDGKITPSGRNGSLIAGKIVMADERRSKVGRLASKDRRSGVDTRSKQEKQRLPSAAREINAGRGFTGERRNELAWRLSLTEGVETAWPLSQN